MRPAAVTSFRLILVAAALAVLMSAGVTSAPRELRVCADPNNLPFSNQKLEGFENKLADLIAADLHATVKYAWFRQRRGYIRRTLQANACDVVTGMPSASEMVLTTKPYYRSTYVFVYRNDENLQLRSFDDSVLRQLKIGLHAIGDDGANPPPVHALARRGIIKNVVGFRMWDVDPVENPQGRIIEAVAKGDIDVAIVWGPLGGYFARRQKADLNVVPVPPSIEPPGIPFVYDISMGVRPGETAFKAELESVLDRRHQDVQKILDEYGIPVVRANAAPSSATGKPAK
jgi:quinoprotein dehydrogenase-associated probable ABC transporter substrate-binding protein